MGRNETPVFVNSLKKWTPLYQLYQDQFNYFDETMSGLINQHFFLKSVFSHTKDNPWVTEMYKGLISQRQRVLYKGDKASYNRLRIQINNLTHRFRKAYYNIKVRQLKDSNSKTWWSSVKELTGQIKAKSADTMKCLANDLVDGDIKLLQIK